MPPATPLKTVSAFERIGGTVVRRTVDRFYDLMDDDPQYQELRALHAIELSPMRESLTGFLTAWLGGPRGWFQDNPGKCMMSAHRDVRITQQTARQWAEAMDRAVADCIGDKEVATKMSQALGALAVSMRSISA
jgi:hemoglobin